MLKAITPCAPIRVLELLARQSHGTAPAPAAGCLPEPKVRARGAQFRHPGAGAHGVGDAADGHRDMLDCPAYSVIWTDIEHTSAIKTKNNKPRETDLFSVWWKDNGWLICPDTKPRVRGGRKPNDIHSHSRDVTQPVLCSQDTGQRPPECSFFSKAFVKKKKKKQFSSTKWKATMQCSSIFKGTACLGCDRRVSRTTREAARAHGRSREQFWGQALYSPRGRVTNTVSSCCLRGSEHLRCGPCTARRGPAPS